MFSGLCGIRPESIKTRIGVVKAYTTYDILCLQNAVQSLTKINRRVGSGPLPTEDCGAIGEKLQSVGHEFG